MAENFFGILKSAYINQKNRKLCPNKIFDWSWYPFLQLRTHSTQNKTDAV